MKAAEPVISVPPNSCEPKSGRPLGAVRGELGEKENRPVLRKNPTRMNSSLKEDETVKKGIEVRRTSRCNFGGRCTPKKGWAFFLLLCHL